jgi:hypothetical protein
VMDNHRFIDWAFDHYRRIAPPEFARATDRPRFVALNR